MPSVKGVSDIPAVGKNLVVLAAVGQVLHFRAFDRDGKMVVDTDEKGLPERARQIADLRRRLESLWPSRELTKSEKARVIAEIMPIVGYTPEEPKTNAYIFHWDWEEKP
jgi:hypothetical protein